MGWSMTLLMLLTAQVGGTAPAQGEGPPALIVQVVDPLWLPMSSIPVAVTPTGSEGQPLQRRTGQKGFTEFWLARGAEYTVEVHSKGFKKQRIEHIRIGKSELSPTAYVQVRLEVRGVGGTE